MKHPLAKRYIAAIYYNRPKTKASEPGHHEVDFWRGVGRVLAEGHFTPQEIVLVLRHKRHHAIMGLVAEGLGLGHLEGLNRLHYALDSIHADGRAT
jgi:hypothetical protein